jgi:hypothetical protein
VRELRPGLWHWEAPHPDWKPGEPWNQLVSSYAIDDGKRLLLFDPLAVPGEIEERAVDREPVVVLTAPWQERDTQGLVERLKAPVFVPPPDSEDDLVVLWPDDSGASVRALVRLGGRGFAPRARFR